jgi:hypothetical protein
MTSDDRKPLEDTPVSQLMENTANNRFGSALSAMYSFWLSKAPAAATLRRDTYTVISFNHKAWVRVIYHSFSLLTACQVSCHKNNHSTPDELLDIVSQNTKIGGGTEFTVALKTIQAQLETTWDPQRYAYQSRLITAPLTTSTASL